METIIRDVRFALRSLRRQPAFTATVVATLAIAIGASTAIFSIVDAALLRSLPFENPDRLAIVSGVAGPQKAIRGASYIEARDWDRLNRTFSAISILDQTSLNLRTEDGADRVPAEMVSSSYFGMVGVTAQIGRTFTAAEDSIPNANPVVVMSDRLWRDKYNADPAILGRSITLNDRPFTVIGVTSPGFAGISFSTDLWFPAAMVQANGGPADLSGRGTRWLGAIGVLRPGVTMEDAQKDMDRVAAQLTRDFPGTNTDRGIQLFSLRQSYLGPTSSVLLAVFGAVGLLLLIACANVIGLQLVRATSRDREIALRVAIGADRQRLAQQLVVEGAVLSLVSAAAGWVVATWALQALVSLTPAGTLPPYATPSLNLTAFAFALAVAVACGIAAGLVPAWRGVRVNLVDSLKEGAKGSAGTFGSRRFGPQQLLVVGEVALALVMLVGAGLFVRSLQNELRVDPGFDAAGVLRARIVLPQQMTPAQRLQFITQFEERLAALPSVRGVTLASELPLAGGGSASFIYLPETQQQLRFYRRSVTPTFFATLDVKVIDGRVFGAEDREGSPPVVVINESAAHRLWPNESAVGKRFRLGSADGPEVSVVGVVADVRYRDLRTVLAMSEPDVYFPQTQRPSGALQIALRSGTPPENLANAVRRELAAINPNVPLYGVQPLRALVEQQTATGRFASSVLSAFGAVALLLSAVGLYGVLAFLVSLRRREIGIRIALGATRGRVQRDVISYGLRLIAMGVTVGVVATAGVSSWIASQLFGVSARDPFVLISVPAMLIAVAVAASWLPARRAAAVDPQEALRLE